ncbi:MAG: type IV pilus assembly protein PilM [Patescibacteria group bacterium]
MKYLPTIISPPNYLAMPSYGLDLSDRTLKFMKFRRAGGRLRIEHYGSKVIPEGLIVSGEIKKSEELSKFIRESCAPIGIKNIITALPEEKAFLRIVQLPKMEPEDIRTALEVNLAEHVPMPASDAVFDFEIASNPDSASEHIDVLLVVFPSTIVESYYNVYSAAEIAPLAFETEMHAISRAVINKEKMQSYLIVDFGRTRTSFIIVSGNQIKFASTIPTSGQDLNKAIARTFGVSLFEAEKMKKDEVDLSNPDVNRKLSESILPIISAIRDEVVNHITYWNAHSSHLHMGESPSIKKILLAGGDSNLVGFVEYLSSSIQSPVEHINAWSNVASFDEYIPEIHFRESLSYAPAIGLALRAINE